MLATAQYNRAYASSEHNAHRHTTQCGRVGISPNVQATPRRVRDRQAQGRQYALGDRSNSLALLL